MIHCDCWCETDDDDDDVIDAVECRWLIDCDYWYDTIFHVVKPLLKTQLRADYDG